MKSLCIVFYLITTTAAIRLTINNSVTVDDVQTMRKLALPHNNEQSAEELISTTSNSQDMRKKIEGVDRRGMQRSDIDEGEFDGGHEGEGLVYNVDYHGVTTHPSPSPKHPNP